MICLNSLGKFRPCQPACRSNSDRGFSTIQFYDFLCSSCGRGKKVGNKENHARMITKGHA
ncbi:hypothetical protein EPI10_005028 [Gossypium australe]|uniref:Uncharacterized protein n=1 Tax=Gossypium australe TaxID=47621 RepID=A0A5B6WM54_9ROSI|nr:hypothetical protein EPI10_005028 [Gossypium australe]